MTTAMLLLAAFLSIVVVGGTLVALYDAAERAWSDAAPAAVARRHTPPRRAGAPAVAWRRLH